MGIVKPMYDSRAGILSISNHIISCIVNENTSHIFFFHLIGWKIPSIISCTPTQVCFAKHFKFIMFRGGELSEPDVSPFFGNYLRFPNMYGNFLKDQYFNSYELAPMAQVKSYIYINLH